MSKSFARARLAASALVLLELAFCAPLLAATPTAQPAAVAAADRFAVDTAQTIFVRGGNAVDAAVAVAFSLAVTYPEAGNIGGGGFMTFWFDQHAYFLDFRERAPLSATRNLYLDDKGAVVAGASINGPRAVGVPGTVAGLYQAQKRFGHLSLAEDMAPAIALARDGFVVDAQLAQRVAHILTHRPEQAGFVAHFGRVKQGELFRQPELAATLMRIAKFGPDDFYRGKTAQLLVKQMTQGGLITARDLAQYRAVWRDPLQFSWEGAQVITAPPPSSGGVALAQLLQMKEFAAPHFAGVPLNSAIYIHRISEIEKRVFADRAEYLGDPEFWDTPTARLIDPPYLARRESEINLDQQSDTTSIVPGLGPEREKPETTHFSIVDHAGNAVSCTYTLNGSFGSGVVVDGAGFVLNNEMDDFSIAPGTPNMYGVVGYEANAIAPGKRPLSSMTPTIVTRNGRLEMVIGTPGGSRIFTSVFQVMTDFYDFHMSLTDAVAALRFHHQLLPAGVVYVEPSKSFEDATRQELESLGYKIVMQNFSGDIQAITITGAGTEAVSDPRARGVARVIP